MRALVQRWSVVLFALAMVSCAQAPPPAATVVFDRAPVFDDAFWATWGDGRAELAGYDLVTPRYGEPRHGTAVTIVVTETFSDEDRVKADPGRHGRTDTFPVMKLNLIQDFATGIYDYNLMTSAFVALTSRSQRPPGGVTKVSFSAQEWCGHAYAQLLFDARYARFTGHSYFDGEADSTSALPVANEAVSEDALLLWARGFSGPVLAAGDSATMPLAGSLRQARLTHQKLALTTVHLSRASAPETVTVPAGTLLCDVYTARVEGGRTWTMHVEQSAPHRLAQWACSDGERAQLLGADRMAYWQLHAPGGEAALAKLGLTPRALRMP